MNLTELEIRRKYRYSNLSYVFDVYMECEYRANLTQEEYDGLAPGEFRFDYKSWERRLGISKKQLVRAIKELAVDNAVITQTFKGKKGISSRYFLTRFEEQKKEQNEELERKRKGTQTSLENTGIEVLGGTEKGNEKGQNEEQKKVHSSQHNNLNIISNNIYSNSENKKEELNEVGNIFDYWNSKGIIKHKKITQEIKKEVTKVLKEYSEEEVKLAIDVYSEILKSEFYFSYKWSLSDFLKRKNGISTFMEEGSNRINYEDWKLKNKPKEAKEKTIDKKLLDMY